MISDNWRSSARSGLEVSSRRRTSSDSGLLSKHLLRIPSPIGPRSWPGCYKRSRKKGDEKKEKEGFHADWVFTNNILTFIFRNCAGVGRVGLHA